MQPIYPDLTAWLLQHPNVAAAIKWQNTQPDINNAYLPPTDANKIAWPAWSAAQQADLINAFLDTVIWFGVQAPQEPMDPNGLTDEPANQESNVGTNSNTVAESVTPDYMWSLYIAHVAFSLAAELTHQFSWSITTYSDDQLRYLFDSTTMGWLIRGAYAMGTYDLRVPALRADNRPKTAFAPPMWTYPFLRDNALIGTTKLETIGKVFDWMRQNMTHFIGSDTYGNCDAVWHYRGYPPLSQIVNGTIDANNPGMGVRHFTMGCHGSVGFLNAVLRMANVPVQPIWVCGHELACFLTESMYLDHGDDPYSQTVISSTAPTLSLLIDEATYQTRFSADLTINPTDPAACNNVGYQANNFPQH